MGKRVDQDTMNIQALNYLASVAFAFLAIALLFVCGYIGNSSGVMKATVAIAALAWFACYVGTLGTTLAYAASLGLTITACVVYLVVFFIVLM
jgi:hypothetical protein